MQRETKHSMMPVLKRILAQKNILAHILVKTVDEFKGMKPEDVVTYIEGEPKVGIVPVEPGLSNIEKQMPQDRESSDLTQRTPKSMRDWSDSILFLCSHEKWAFPDYCEC